MTYDSTTDAASSALFFDVTVQDVAEVLGSGDVPVLATPRLLAWCEASTCQEAERAGALPEGSTSVGSRVELSHLLPTPVGGRIRVQAQLVDIRGRILVFDVTATDRSGQVVATGQIHRAVLDRQKFLARVPLP